MIVTLQEVKDKSCPDIKKNQNEGGSFGNGLESDFPMPFSSPMATSIGLRIIKAEKEVGKELKWAMQYLENNFFPPG